MNTQDDETRNGDNRRTSDVKKEERVGAVLGKQDIIQCQKDGKIVISPLNVDWIQNSSVDVSLGEYFYRQKSFNSGENEYINPFSNDPREKLWGDLEEAFPFSQYDPVSKHPPSGINLKEDSVIVVRAGETILCHTKEFIGGVKGITTMLKAKSTLGRCGIEVCKCAGWGDVGYFNRWTFEITNNLSSSAVVLPVGSRIAQIVFFPVTKYEEGDAYSKTGGSYQTAHTLEELQKNWTPESMLPKSKTR